MVSPHYTNHLVDCQTGVQFDKIAGKTIVLTGGKVSLAQL